MMAEAIFHRVLKLQIGCGAEPTMYGDMLPELVRIGKAYNIPYVSLTTNGNLLSEDKLEALAAAGLDELTLSIHGLRRETYEYFMQYAKFDKLKSMLSAFRSVKTRHPNLKLRINYTVNEDNVEELADFPKVFEDIPISILQVRPVQDLGESEYKNFSMGNILKHYDEIFPALQRYCEKQDITLMFPTKENLSVLAMEMHNHTSNGIMDLIHIYAYPKYLHRSDFDFRNEKFEHYCKRTGYAKTILHDIISYKTNKGIDCITKPLNYNIRN